MSLRALRLTAVLLPAALLLHEVVYALAGGGLLGAHGYLEVVVPLGAALVASLALAALLLPVLGLREGPRARHAPLALAGTLLGIFVVQELAEAILLGGGLRGLAASAAVAWLAPPLALVLGALATVAIGGLERVADELVRTLTPVTLRRARSRSVGLAPVAPILALPASCGLAFGFARRPPPRPR